MAMAEVLTASRQNPPVERVIGSLRRWLDPVIVFNERSLYDHLQR
jgi:hypothetical protein